MKISDYLKEDMICLNLKSSNKKEVIKELGEIIRTCKDITNCDVFINDVLEREKIATTGIGDEIAIPHARTDSVSQFVIALGRAEEGIEFESLDDKKVKLVFLMGTPKTAGINHYLQLLAHLSRLLKKESFRKLLIKAEKPSDIICLFKEVEK